MNVRNIKRDIAAKYPGATIIALPSDHPKEILCEIEPATEHPDYSIAISLIEKSEPHYHKIATEEYEVISGEVTLYLGDEKRVMKVGDKAIIKPGTVHWARSNSGWIKCTSRPGWTPSDHVLADKEDTNED